MPPLLLALAPLALAADPATDEGAAVGPLADAPPLDGGLADAGAPTADRVPGQRAGDPFAIMTIGPSFSALLPAAGAWSIPTGGALEEAPSAPLYAGALSIGGLHFHGQAELYLELPLLSPSTEAAGRQVSAGWTVATGARIYPSPLLPGTIRPHVSTELATRQVCLEPSDDPTADFGCQSKLGAPVGAGLGWRARGPVMVDLNASYQIVGPFLTWGDLSPQRLGVDPPADEAGFMNLTGLRLAAAVKWSPDLTAGVISPGFAAAAGARYDAQRRAGRASGLSLALGPSARVFYDLSSDYFVEQRPYLADAYGESLSPHGSIGWYFDRGDAELRLAGRPIWGAAEAWGASLETRRLGAFVEGVKMIPLDYYGFVPFVGAGVGFEWIALIDEGAGERSELERGKIAPSIVFGWDIRPDPSSWWLLRTGLRWIPRSEVELGGVNFDLAGLEYDFIQLRVQPSKIGRSGED